MAMRGLGLVSIIALWLVGCTGPDHEPAKNPGSESVAMERVRVGCGPLDAPMFTGVLTAPSGFVGKIVVSADGKQAGAGAVQASSDGRVALPLDLGGLSTTTGTWTLLSQDGEILAQARLSLVTPGCG